ncbi:BTAD domain-containing putative transcriptional regulator [Microbispora hainanensis]|uniref:AfsR/SARP family transcriptional regulator n=1 Tax=Microbispora hainanensis TaxID=568844 RepID=UPI0033D7E207
MLFGVFVMAVSAVLIQRSRALTGGAVAGVSGASLPVPVVPDADPMRECKTPAKPVEPAAAAPHSAVEATGHADVTVDADLGTVGETSATEVVSPQAATTSGLQLRVPPSALVSGRLFGRTRVQAADREVGFTRAEGRNLFALLATSKDGVRQDLVIEHLWPEQGEHGSQHLETGVRDINAALRSATGLSTGVRFVIKTGQRRHLASAFFDIDLWRFEQAHLMANTAPEEDIRMQALRQMVAIHEGPLLAERGDFWCLPLQQAAARKATNAAMRLADLEHKTDPDHALDLLTLAVDRIDPYSEVLWCRIMTIHGELGRLPAVRAAFQQFTERLREVDAEPSRQARQIYRGLAG